MSKNYSQRRLSNLLDSFLPHLLGTLSVIKWYFGKVRFHWIIIGFEDSDVVEPFCLLTLARCWLTWPAMILSKSLPTSSSGYTGWNAERYSAVLPVFWMSTSLPSFKLKGITLLQRQLVKSWLSQTTKLLPKRTFILDLGFHRGLE